MSLPATIEPRVTSLFDLAGKVALLTGASGYLGAAMARGLAEVGASVVAASRDVESARRCASALPASSSTRHYGVELDQLDDASLAGGFQEAVRLGGQIDVLVNNAHEIQASDWTDVDGEQFRRQLANAAGYFQLARLVHQHAVARRAPASIIMLGSMYGLVGSYPDVYEGICPASPVAYHTLKGGILHMTRHLAVYWAKDRVRVNCLSPGPFPDPERAPPALVQRLKAKSPLGRMGLPHELKGAVVFLASDASSYMTGQNLVIDGGWTAW